MKWEVVTKRNLLFTDDYLRFVALLTYSLLFRSKLPEFLFCLIKANKNTHYGGYHLKQEMVYR